MDKFPYDGDSIQSQSPIILGLWDQLARSAKKILRFIVYFRVYFTQPFHADFARTPTQIRTLTHNNSDSEIYRGMSEALRRSYWPNWSSDWLISRSQSSQMISHRSNRSFCGAFGSKLFGFSPYVFCGVFLEIREFLRLCDALIVRIDHRTGTSLITGSWFISGFIMIIGPNFGENLFLDEKCSEAPEN